VIRGDRLSREIDELIAISYAQRMGVTYQSDQEIEKAHLQYVSMNVRLVRAPAFPGAAAHRRRRRFAQDSKVIGRTFRLGYRLYEIVGAGPERFTGTETGTVTDIFVPTMMHPGAVLDDWTWHRTLARMEPGAAVEPVRQRLDATSRAFEEERAKGFSGMTRQSIDRFLDQKVLLEPAAARLESIAIRRSRIDAASISAPACERQTAKPSGRRASSQIRGRIVAQKLQVPDIAFQSLP